MKKFVRKFLSITLGAALIAGTLMGCQKGSGETGGESSESPGEAAMGRYVESEMKLPEEEANIVGFGKLEDGTLKLMTIGEEGKTKRWKSTDKGENWEKEADLPAEIASQYITSCSIAANGSIAMIAYNIENQETAEFALYVMDKDDNLTKLDVDVPKFEESNAADGPTAVGGVYNEEEIMGEEITVDETMVMEGRDDVAAEGGVKEFEANSDFTMENEIGSVQMTDDGQLLGMDYTGKVFLINSQDGKIERTFNGGSSGQSFFVAGNTIGIMGYEGSVQLFDFASGDPISDQVLSDEIIKGNSQDMGFYPGSVLVRSGNEENSIYFCNSSGLHRHIIGGTVTEEVIDGALSALGNPGIMVNGMVVVSDEEFVMSIIDNEGVSKLLRYTYSKDTLAKPSKEITVYSLEDNLEVRQAISTFQSSNPEYYINFEVGITGEDGMTASDALRTLNTDIMAGKGPDVILLDGIPIDSYVEKGILADISGIIEEVAAKDGVFENITGAYAKDGKYYAVPMKFAVPFIAGGEAVQNTKDLKSLTDQVAKLREENADIRQIVGASTNQELALKIYQLYSSLLQNEDGSLNEEKLEELFTQLKRLAEANDLEVEAGLTEGMSAVTLASTSYSMDDISMDIIQLLSKDVKVSAGRLGSVDGFNTLVSGSKQIEDIGYGLWQLSEEKIFVPNSVIGINSKSERMDDAKIFVSYLLGKEAQKISQGGGFPINRAAYEESIINKNEGEAMSSMMVSDQEGGDTISLEINWSSKEEFAELQSILESVDTPMLSDSVIKQAVLEQAEACMNSDITPEVAAKTVMQKINLYLAE